MNTMYVIKCLNCNEEDRRRYLDKLYCGYCGNEEAHDFETREWKLHKLLKPETIEKAIEIDNRYRELPESKNFFHSHKTKEYQEIIKLKLELVKYFEWCYEKFGISCLEDMHYSFDDYCYSIRKHISNPLRFCELSNKIPWIN